MVVTPELLIALGVILLIVPVKYSSLPLTRLHQRPSRRGERGKSRRGFAGRGGLLELPIVSTSLKG